MNNTKHIKITAVVLTAAVFICGCAILGIAAANKQKSEVGFVSAVKGKAAIMKGKNKGISLDGMNAIHIGDNIKVAPKSSATVNLCASGSKIVVKGEASFNVTAKGLKFSKGKAGSTGVIEKTLCATLAESAAKYDKMAKVEDLSEAMGAMSSVLGVVGDSGKSGSSAMKSILNEKAEEYESAQSAIEKKVMKYAKAEESFEKSEVTRGGGGGGMSLGMEDYPPAPAAEPPMATVYEDTIYKPDVVYLDGALSEVSVFSRPFLSFGSMGVVSTFKVKITNSQNAVVFQASLDKPYLEYPADAEPLLPGGWYLCEVSAMYPEGTEIEMEVYGLSVKDENTQRMFAAEENALKELIADSPSAENFTLLGKLYEANNLSVAAVGAYEKALAAEPDNPALLQRMNDLKATLK